MPTLTAKYHFETDSPCLLQSEMEGFAPSITATVNGFSATATLVGHQENRARLAGVPSYWITRLIAIDLTLSRDDPEHPPVVEVDEQHRRLLSPLANWLRPRLDIYRACAELVLTRVFDFFKYQIGTPMVPPLPSWSEALNNPDWFGHNGNELPRALVFFGSARMPGLEGRLEVATLTPSRVEELSMYLRDGPRPSLAVQLLADARTAWYEGHHRRAVIELAISSEILVKRRFFSLDTPAGAAFDFLEDKGKVSVRVLDLVDTVAREAFGASFRQQHPEGYRQLDYLFRCRNKLAHRGELTF